ncbi:disease resistance protein RUN1 [Trifolium repens]|nr:disease resistance protein RUN1 [Trifolium repens]
MSSNVKYLCIKESNLSDECLPIVVGWFSHLGQLRLNKSNIRFLPKYLKECRYLQDLNVDDCKSLVEIRGIPPNLACFSAVNCESLNSPSRSMLVNQELHDCSRETKFCFPGGSDERVPKWFEHQSMGPTKISVWFRKKIPCLILFFSTEWPYINFISDKHRTNRLRVNLFTNGHTYTLFHQISPLDSMLTDHIYLNYFEFDQLVHRWDTYTKFESKLDEAFLKNEWIHMELKLENHSNFSKMMKPLSAKFGIHVMEYMNNLEDIKFTNPYRKRKSDEYLSTSLSQFYPILKKQRFVDMELFETELGQHQQRMSLSSLIPIGLERVASLLARLKTRTASCSTGSLNMVVNECGGRLLLGDSYPDWLTFNFKGSSVIFEVPQVQGHNLKTMMCVIYSSTPDNIASDGLKNVLVKNYTTATIQLYKREVLVSFEEEEGERVVSSIEPGNKVEVVAVFENDFVVKETIVYLVYDEPIGEKMEKCQDQEKNDIVYGGDDNEGTVRTSSPQVELMDENGGAASCCGLIKYSFRQWITDFMRRVVECR